MLALKVNLDGVGAFAEIAPVKIEQATDIEVLLLDGGMDSGKPSVTIHISIDGRHVIAQTSARLFCTAARMIMAKYPDLFED